MAEIAARPTPPGLRKDAIGLREVLFQSITDMAPGAAIAASIPAGAAFAGGALPLSVLIALVGALLSAFCIGELAKNLPPRDRSAPTWRRGCTRASASWCPGVTSPSGC